ncbi:MAG: hypothetical protein KY443_11875 [Actinobacteria bacterium]|nr:hypothetical protein [Actinomycetota bacterium]
MLFNPFVHAHLARERMQRYEHEAALARLLSAPRRARPDAEADRGPSPSAVIASAGAGPPQ